MSQIKLLLDVISDVRSLGDSLQAYADALTASDKLEVEGFEHAEHPTVRCADTISAEYQQIYPPADEQLQSEPVNPEPSTKPVTLAEVRAVLANKSRAGFTEEVKQLVMKHGAEKLSGVPESEYAALMKEAESLGG